MVPAEPTAGSRTLQLHSAFVLYNKVDGSSGTYRGAVCKVVTQANINLVTVPPESDSQVTQVDIRGGANGQVGHTGQNQLCSTFLLKTCITSVT